jgi:hypothetical protein
VNDPQSEDGNEMTRTGYVDKAQVVADLRARDLHSRADWVDRVLPARIDTSENASLLRTLGIEVPAAPQEARTR